MQTSVTIKSFAQWVAHIQLLMFCYMAFDSASLPTLFMYIAIVAEVDDTRGLAAALRYDATFRRMIHELTVGDLEPRTEVQELWRTQHPETFRTQVSQWSPIGVGSGGGTGFGNSGPGANASGGGNGAAPTKSTGGGSSGGFTGGNRASGSQQASGDQGASNAFKSNKACRYWSKDKTCRFGDKCRFTHA